MFGFERKPEYVEISVRLGTDDGLLGRGLTKEWKGTRHNLGQVLQEVAEFIEKTEEV